MKITLFTSLWVLSSALFGCSTTCKGVIGAPYNPRTNQVLYTIPGSPAEWAALQPGDELLYPETINGEPGTEVTFRFIRGGSKVYVTTLGRVCVDELLEWKASP